MITPNPNFDAGRPSDIEEDNNTSPDGDQYASGNPETVTQADLADSDGAGIRGNYGDAEQTSGLEGGQQSPADEATNASQPTDTELTGS